MRVLVTGAGGQLGGWLARHPPAGWEVTALPRAALDITCAEAVARALAAHRPQAIVNAAAYTAVDRAESSREAALLANAEGPAILAAAAARVGARLVHLSTDFVFDGERGRPWRPDDRCAPVNAYGASKRAGEEAVLAADPENIVLRASWLYAPGGRNFVQAMLRAMAEGRPLRVVADQTGGPTFAATVARTLAALLNKGAEGIWHCADLGVASWYDFACAIGEEAAAGGLIGRVPEVAAISSAEWLSAARRPAFSVLDCSATWTKVGWAPPHWRSSLRQALTAWPRS